MGKRSLPPEKPPSIAPEQAVPILEDLIRQGEELKKVHRDSPEQDEWVQTAESLLEAAFGSYSSNLQAFGRAQTGVYHPSHSEAFRQKQFLDQLSGMIAVLQSAVKQLRWKLKDPNQVFLPAGSQHDAYIEFRKIVQLATNDILIVDTYVDGTLWQLLTNLASNVKIRILTDQMKGDFRLEAGKFAAQHGNTVEVRQTTNYHDRFIIEDAKRCWHIGASIKDAGNKAFAFSEIERREVADFVRSDVENQWLTAIKIPF
jgi:hypothetical protein